MNKIVLSTLNAKYIHASFGLRYLKANLGDLKEDCKIIEFEINDRVQDIAEILLRDNPTILGLGIYIWNVKQSLELVKLLKKVAPSLVIILGGPEVSYESSDQEIVKYADFTITGEADQAFREVCSKILAGQLPDSKIIYSKLPKLEEISLPYEFYTEKDCDHRIVYVEASRGCPFTCEFCLSSLDIPVRQFDIDVFLSAMESLLEKGVTQFKFVDRTFNLNIRISKRIMEFFLERHRPGLFLHFEMIPDRLPEALKESIMKFPKGALQFEVGIQTFNPEVSALISRRQDYPKIAENLTFLRQNTGVHVHADLIAGLPGESLESFAKGFDWLLSIGPQEIQVGILKRLRGTPIIRHDQEWQMVYNDAPPYEILHNKLLDFQTLQRIGRFAHFWDRYSNSGQFKETLPLIWKSKESPFFEFMSFSEWLYRKAGKRHAISLPKLTDYLWSYLTLELAISGDIVGKALASDICNSTRKDFPVYLTPYKVKPERERNPELPKRQSLHL